MTWPEFLVACRLWKFAKLADAYCILNSLSSQKGGAWPVCPEITIRVLCLVVCTCWRNSQSTFSGGGGALPSFCSGLHACRRTVGLRTLESYTWTYLRLGYHVDIVCITMSHISCWRKIVCWPNLWGDAEEYKPHDMHCIYAYVFRFAYLALKWRCEDLELRYVENSVCFPTWKAGNTSCFV